MSIKLMTISNSFKEDSKERMMYIFKGYKNSRPAQSNLFGSILNTYKGDMLDNANNVDLQRDAIQNSLISIYDRYGYTNITVDVVYRDEYNLFEIDITATDSEDVEEKLSDTLILEY